MTSTQPSPPPTTADLAALDDLTALAAALNQRGHTTRLAARPPRLTLQAPGLDCPQHICAGTAQHPEWFCWQCSCIPQPPAPFSLRTDPLSRTAARAANVLRMFTAAHQQPAPGQDPRQQDTG